MYRQAIPDSFASHPFFASSMKIDQSLHKFLAVHARRREAFMKVLYADAWVIRDTTHAVDCGPSSSMTRCDLAMRFAVYNELQFAAVKAPNARDGVFPQRASAAAGSAGEDNGEEDDEMATARVRPGKPSTFETVLRRLLVVARSAEDQRVKYQKHLLRLIGGRTRTERGGKSLLPKRTPPGSCPKSRSPTAS